MLRRKSSLAALFLLIFAIASPAALPPGRPLGEIQIPGPKGPINFSQFRGKPLLIALISTGCQHCLTATPVLVKIQNDFRARGLRVVAGVADNAPAETVGPFVEKYQINFPVGYVDKALFQKIAKSGPNDVLYVPTFLFVDAAGMVRLQVPGNDASLKAGMDKVLPMMTEQLVGSALIPAPAAKK